MNKMIVANLAYRPLRSIISILAVAIEVTLILLIVGLALGILEDNKARQVGIGADVTVRPPGSSREEALRQTEPYAPTTSGSRRQTGWLAWCRPTAAHRPSTPAAIPQG